MEQLRDQHVIVTGATGVVGRAVATALLACGAEVTAAARRRTALDALRAELRDHDRLHVAEADVADGAAVERLFDAIERGTGPVTGVVHCVGTGLTSAGLSLVELADGDVAGAAERGLVTAVLVTRAALRRMSARRSGRVVLVTSADAARAASGRSVHAAVSAAVAHFAQSAAREARAAGVTVNALLVGAVQPHAQRARAGESDPGRLVAPAVVAEAAIALLGDGGRGISGAWVTLPDAVT